MKKISLIRGQQYRSTGSNPAASAVASVLSTRRACSLAAPISPSSGTRRDFTRPGSGARANTMSAGSGLVRVAPRKLIRGGTEEIREAQLPHEEHRAQYAAPFPAAARSHRLVAQAGGRR